MRQQSITAVVIPAFQNCVMRAWRDLHRCTIANSCSQLAVQREISISSETRVHSLMYLRQFTLCLCTYGIYAARIITQQ